VREALRLDAQPLGTGELTAIDSGGEAFERGGHLAYLQRLGVTGALYRTLRSTNAIENLNGLAGHFVHNVRRWRDGTMLVRWIATALQDAQQRFRRIKGCGEMPALIRALDRHQVDTKKAVA
jgi:hypothetical protein